MLTGKKVASFQERFADLVDESEKTLTQLSKELHMSNQTLSAWRNGSRSPKEPTIIAIAKYFNVDVRWLMGFDVRKEAERIDPIPIVVPNSALFSKVVQEMHPDDYRTVMEIFENTYNLMKERGEID